jgi:NAD-specific glutamate dehydrogenase
MTLRRDIALRVLDSADGRPIPRAMEDYLERRSEPYERLNRLVNSLSAQGESSLAALTVALRQVRGLAGN